MRHNSCEPLAVDQKASWEKSDETEGNQSPPDDPGIFSTEFPVRSVEYKVPDEVYISISVYAETTSAGGLGLDETGLRQLRLRKAKQTQSPSSVKTREFL